MFRGFSSNCREILVKKKSCSTKYELKANGFGQIVFKAWFYKKHKTYDLTNLATLATLTALTEFSQEEAEFELTACRYLGASRDKKSYPISIPRYKLCLPPSSLRIEAKKQQIGVVNDLRVWCCIREAISGYGLRIQELDRPELERVRVEFVQLLSDDFELPVESVETFLQSKLFKEKVKLFFCF